MPPFSCAGQGESRVTVSDTVDRTAELFEYPGTLWGSSVTDQTGYFRVTGARGPLMKVDLSQASGYKALAIVTWTCADAVVLVENTATRGLVRLERIITPSLAVGAQVAPGPLTLTWNTVDGASTYCVSLRDVTTGSSLTPGSCVDGSTGSQPYVATSRASWTTPTLVAGHGYSLMILAVVVTAKATESYTVGSGNTAFTVR